MKGLLIETETDENKPLKRKRLEETECVFRTDRRTPVQTDPSGDTWIT